jgi:carbonic anhydrase/acetyltransferase-like protein (isoleucine patch superfamily)
MIRSVNGKTPKIHPGAFVSEAAYVIGDVEIGEGSSVWPGSVVRGDAGKIVIGRNTCIQDNSVVHGDADVDIGDDVVVAHRVVCHGRSIGNRVLLGNGCIVNDGVHIGDDSLIASGAMVVDRMDIPARSVVAGLPARIRRDVEEKDMVLIKGYRDIYVRNTAMYLKESLS